MSCKYRQTKMH